MCDDFYVRHVFGVSPWHPRTPLHPNESLTRSRDRFPGSSHLGSVDRVLRLYSWVGGVDLEPIHCTGETRGVTRRHRLPSHGWDGVGVLGDPVSETLTDSQFMSLTGLPPHIHTRTCSITDTEPKETTLYLCPYLPLLGRPGSSTGSMEWTGG